MHRHTIVLTITATALLPEPVAAVPTFGTVVWRNGGSEPVAIDLADAACNECDTVIAFSVAQHGATSAVVAAGDIAALCFHEAGKFPYVARVGAVLHRGVVLVGGAP